MILDADGGKNDWCHYCHELRKDHARGSKCLYGPENFYQAVCKECRRLLDMSNATAQSLPTCVTCSRTYLGYP